MVRAGCVFVAGIHLSRTWMSGSFESVRWNACVHRLDLGLYSHPKEFWGNGVWIQGKNPLYRKMSPEEYRTRDTVAASPSTTNWAIPAHTGSDSITYNSFGWQYKPKTCLCTHAFHHTDSKDPNIHILDMWMPATKTNPACTIHEDEMWLRQWLDSKSHMIKSHKKWWTLEI